VKITLILIAILFTYGTIATIFSNSNVAGNWGQRLGIANIEYFGYFAYIDFALLYVLIYTLFKYKKYRFSLDFHLGWMLSVISILFIQALLAPEHFAGFVGLQVIEFLQPLIGKAGLWLSWLMIFALNILFVFEDKLNLSSLNIKIDKDIDIMPKSATPSEKRVVKKQKEPSTPSIRRESKKVDVRAKKESIEEGVREKIKSFKNPFSTPEVESKESSNPLDFEDELFGDTLRDSSATVNATSSEPITESNSFDESIFELNRTQPSKPKPQIKVKKPEVKSKSEIYDSIFGYDDTTPSRDIDDISDALGSRGISSDNFEIPTIKESVDKTKKSSLKEEFEEEFVISSTPAKKVESIAEDSVDELDIIQSTLKRKKSVAPRAVETKRSSKSEDLLSKIAKKVEVNSIKDEPKRDSIIVNELEENSKLLNIIEKGKVEKPKNFELPPLDFLQEAPKVTKKINEAEIDRKIEELLMKLQQFRVEGDVVRTYSGPLVTTFEFKPAPNVKVSKILGLQDDLAMALRAETIRIQAPIPGRDVVGIEIPNESIETIYLREILESKLFQESKSPLTVALGKDIVGNPFITDIKKLPHLLIAGTTGSGKSVGINAMILSLLYRNDPENLKLMLIDPKMLEFSMYDDIPHLITPVIIEPAKAIAALANMVGEMERRYKLMAESRTKTIDNYNDKVKKDGSGEPFPYIVVVIDELADLMMNGGKEVELSIARLAQKSRACGIHLIVATQRPSVDVVTGLIKANLPSRLSYRVGQKIDSKVILDALGAESLLGRGDGLFTPPGTTGLVRIHAPWNTEDEIEEIVEFLKAQREPDYDESYLIAGGSAKGSSGDDEDDIVLDELYERAKDVVLSDKKTSISYLQRKLQIGYNRSANIIEQLEKMGVLSEPNAKGNREIIG